MSFIFPIFSLRPTSRNRLKGESQHDLPFRSHHDRSNIQRLTNIIEDYPQKINEYKEKIEETQAQIKHVENELTKTFPHEQELMELIKKQNELNLKMEFEEKIREKNNAQKVSDASQEASAEVIINIPSSDQENRVKNKALITERTY